MGEKNILEWKIKCNYRFSSGGSRQFDVKMEPHTFKKIYIRQLVKRLTWDRKEDTVNKFMTVPSHL